MFEKTRAPLPHGDQMILQHGAPLDEAESAMILVHGRGASAQNILTLTPEFKHQNLTYLAPQAAGHTWYPYSFMAPKERNEPGLSSALSMLKDLVARLEDEAEIPASRVFLLGFSQGACLATEFAARFPQRYGGIIAFTGGLIGPPGGLLGYEGSLQDTPIFLGSGDPDPHVPWHRVEESAEILKRMNADVQHKRYPGLPHTIHEDEIKHARQILDRNRVNA